MKDKISLLYLINILGLLLFNINLAAQEVLIQLDGNPVLQKHYLEHKTHKGTSSIDTLELPFFDDFSTSNIYPDPILWSDKDAYVNDNFAVDPPSVGVATLDAINWKGEFYESASYGNDYSADNLTSNPINLNYPGDQSIFLSFFYQPQGIGDYPEVGDSLILEFYAPDDAAWNTVWKKEGSQVTEFQQQIIQVGQEKYLKKGFKFRFRNIASLSGNQQPSEVINVDHWNLDYIYLNKGRNINDLINHDISFVYPLAALLKNYESMPWTHFLVDRKSELKTNVNSILRNNDNTTRLINSIYFVFYDNNGYEINDTLFGGAYNIDAGSQIKFDPPFTYPFFTNTTDSASFLVKAHFDTDTEDPIQNNVLVYTQKFYDYYSYDDGSAEVGYGLIGEGTQNALLAYKFDCKKQDTLKAVQMYFNRSLNDKSQKYFYLTIWDDNGGKPGQVIYKREGIRPEYEGELNKFHTYYIDDTTLVLNRVFYVGWQQTTSDLLNIGFDYNRKRNDKIFYNINGSWANSKFEGALMIRTFFGKYLTTEIGPEIEKSNPLVKIFPNPSNDNITVQLENDFDNSNVTLSIYNLSGSLVHQSLQNNNTQINLSHLKEGVYILRLIDKKKSLNYTCKLIKIK